MSKNILDNQFYCCKCGQRGLPIIRRKGKERERGHLKKLFCFNCNEETNFCEISPFSQKYTYDDFLLELKFNNFDENQNRKMPYGLFKDKLVKKGVDIHAEKEKINSNDRNCGLR